MVIMARYWFLLAISYPVIHAVLFYTFWNIIDFRIEVMIQYVGVPFIQAMALAWVAGVVEWKEFIKYFRKTVFQPYLLIVYFADCALLCLLINLNIDIILIIVWMISLKLIATGTIILFFLYQKYLDKIILSFAISIIFLGITIVYPLMGKIQAYFSLDVVIITLFSKKSVIYLFALAFMITNNKRIMSFLSAKSFLSGFFFNISQLFIVITTMAIMMNYYFSSTFVSPWKQIILTFGFLASTSLFLSALCLLFDNTIILNQKECSSTLLNRNVKILELWFIFVSSCLAITICNLLFFHHRYFPTRIFVSCVFITFFQALTFQCVQISTKYFQKFG